ncbi:ferrichrome ABC transporter substrate-binding protein, partial [Staphylococcus saprophyticus]|nr:ferrichrome ABC transporter substrate-binding protein [Staphylococcus saprophyticus]
VIKFDVTETQYNDPISLEKQRDIFYKALKSKK